MERTEFYYELSEEELKERAMEKNKRGVATKRALRAQGILWERSLCF